MKIIAGITLTVSITMVMAVGRSAAQEEAAAGNGSTSEQSSVLGASVGSDYVAKHFSLLIGAVVLSPFEFTDPDAGGNNAGKKFVLNSGDATARAFLEGGFRYRWAWLDRLPEIEIRRQEALRRAPQDLRRKLEAAQQNLVLAQAELKARKGEQQRFNAAAAAGDGAVGALAVQKRALDDQVAAGENVVAEKQILLARARQEILVGAETKAYQAWDAHQEQGSYFGPRYLWSKKAWFSLLPDDWEARMGFVFDGSSDTTTSTVVGGSDLYAQVAMGWNILRWSLPTISPEETPIRGAIDLEGALSLVTDSKFTDVHERYLIGPSLVFGIPLIWTTPAEDEEDDSTAETGARREHVALPIIEIVTRAGAVNVDTPRFVPNAGREVRVEQGAPAYRGRWGFGLDMEINVPITRSLGYLVARGSLNAGFDPNPWSLQLGYTIPLSTLAQGLTAGAGSTR